MSDKTPETGKVPPRLGFGAIVLALTVPLSFLIVFALLIINGEHGPRMYSTGLVLSLGLALLAIIGVFFMRWLADWRNVRRLIFAVACLITLVALFYAEEDLRGRHAWKKHRAMWEEKGEKFEISALAPPPVPDDKNLALGELFKPVMDFSYGTNGIVWHDTNGVARLQRFAADLPPGRKTNDALNLGSLEKGTFADLATWAAFYRGNTNYPQAPASATPVEVTLAALGGFDPQLKELREEAAARPLTRFPIGYTYEPSWGILLPHLAHIKHVVIFLNAHAVAELEAGHADGALVDLKLALRLSDDLGKEPLLIDHLVRIACTAINLQTLREGIHRHAWNDAQLLDLQNNLGSIDLIAGYDLSLRGEIALSTGGLDFMRRQGWRMDPMMYMSDEGGSGMAGTFNAMPGGWLYQNMVTISEMIHEYPLAATDEKNRRVFPDVSKKGMDAVGRLPMGPYTIFAKMLLPAFQGALSKSARMQTFVDEAQIACALERYRLANGKLPERLGVLTPKFIERLPNDVITGAPLHYRVDAGDGYILYSVGWNETDDNGEIVLSKNKKNGQVDITQGDWVWSMPGK